MTSPGPSVLTDTEAWFIDHGLPYFVDEIRDQVGSRLHRGRLLLVLIAAVGLGLLAGFGFAAWAVHDFALALAAGASVALVVAAVAALQTFKAEMIATWAVRRTFASLGLLVPLATRALPMLLLFVLFLFINADVWQVASEMTAGVLWGSGIFFAVAALLFLLARLDEELDAFDEQLGAEGLVEVTRGTPTEAMAQHLAAAGGDLHVDAQVSGLQKANLMLVLLVAKALQVLLLSLAVFGFFLVFGLVIINDADIVRWVGHAPTPLPQVSFISHEHLNVSVFLACFSGLQFTVVAVTDEVYRAEFFTKIMREMSRVLGVRACYVEMRKVSEPEPPPPAPR